MSVTHRARVAYRIVSVLTAFLVINGLGSASPRQHVFPGEEWGCDAAGLSPKVVGEVDAFVRTLDTTGLIVVKSGKVDHPSQAGHGCCAHGQLVTSRQPTSQCCNAQLLPSARLVDRGATGEQRGTAQMDAECSCHH